MSTDDDSCQGPSPLIKHPTPLQIPGAFHPFTPMPTPMSTPAPSPAPVCSSAQDTYFDPVIASTDSFSPSQSIQSPAPAQQHSSSFSFGAITAPGVASSQSLRGSSTSRPSSALSQHQPAPSRHRNSITAVQRRPSSSLSKRRVSNELEENSLSISHPNSSAAIKARLVPQRDLQQDEAYLKLKKETEVLKQQRGMTDVAEVLETKDMEIAAWTERSNANEREIEWMRQQVCS